MPEEERQNLAEADKDHITIERNSQKNSYTIKMHFAMVQKQPLEVFCKKIWQISQENTCVGVSFY